MTDQSGGTSSSSDGIGSSGWSTAPVSRRGMLQAGAAAAAAGWAVLGGQPGAAYAVEGKRGPAAKTLPFNADWLFGGVATSGSSDPGFDDSRFDTVTLPHTVVPLSWREWDNETWEKVWIYRRHFQVPKRLRGMRLFLDFDGAMTASTLTLNGERLGEHVGGYLPFRFEITDAVADGDNVLAVELDSRFNINVPPNRPEPHGPRSVDFWQPGGIYRQASLRAVPKVFVADVFAKPVDVLSDKRRMDVECVVDAARAGTDAAEIRVELLSDGRRIAAASAPVDAGQAGQTTARVTVHGVADVDLWDIDDPRLYDVVATLYVDGSPVHDHATRVGFREAEFTKNGFFLNGRRVKLFGTNRHQFYPFAGGSMPARVQRRDAEILKRDLNCNMVRGSHYPEAEAFFDACDELGLLAWEEAPGWGLFIGDDQWQERAVRQVGDMVRRDRNHPSIVIWGARLNETHDDVELWGRTRDLAHALDDSRPTTGAMIGGKADSQDFVQDVFSLNDYWREDDHAALRPPRTDFPYLVSEAVGTLSGDYEVYRRTAPAEVQQGQAFAHAWVFQESYADDRYCGLLPWGGFDYVSGTGNRYQGIKFIGVADLFREPKLGAAIYAAQVDPRVRPVIAPAFYWDFGPDTLPMDDQAMICSNCDRLELYVGGEHYRTVRPDTERFGDLPYPPSFVDFGDVDPATLPVLRIDGLVDGERVVSRRFAADPAGDVLSVTVDDEELVADGADATRVVFRVLDEHGAPRYYVDGVAEEVRIRLDGPGQLVGDDPFAFAAAGGVGAVWLRTEYGVAGATTVTVTHPSLGSGEVTVRAKRPRGVPPQPNVDLVVESSRSVLQPGDTAGVTATLTNAGHPAARDVDLTLSAPRGWSVAATSPTHFAVVRPGQAVRATWDVTAADGASGEVTLTGHATFEAGGDAGSEQDGVTFVVPAPAQELAETFDNTGISDDSDVDEADLDGVGNSYSQQALVAAGLAPGTEVTHAGLVFTWPDLPSGQPSNVVASGETVAVSGSGDTLGFLGAATGGSSGGRGRVYYTDGTLDEYRVQLSDYFFPPGSGNETVAEMPYLNSQGVGGRPRGQRDHTVYVFYAAVRVDPGKQVRAVQLPDTQGEPGGRVTGMHVFALAVGDAVRRR